MKRKDNITALVNCLKAVCRNLEALTEFMESVKDSETDINTFNTSANVKSKERKEETKEMSPEPPFQKEKKEKKESRLDVCVRKPNERETSLKKKMDDRALAFQEQVRPFVERYGRELCNDFYAYWTEPNPTGKRMRFDCRRKRNPGDSLHHSGLFCIVASSVQLKRIKNVVTNCYTTNNKKVPTLFSTITRLNH